MHLYIHRLGDESFGPLCACRYPKHVIEMLLKVRERREQLDKCKAPLLVHCSAGVGRTGTFIAIDHVISALLQRDRVDLNAIIAALRKDRMALVQQ